MHMFKRISITLPEVLTQKLKNKISKGELSNFVAEAIDQKLMETHLLQDENRTVFERVKELRKKTKPKTVEQIIELIKKGRN